MTIEDLFLTTQQLAGSTKLAMSKDFTGKNIQPITGHSVVLEYQGQYYGLNEISEKGIPLTQCQIVFLLWPKE